MIKNNKAIAIAMASLTLLACMAVASFAQSSTKGDFPAGSYQDGDFIVTFSSDGKFIVENDVVVKAQGVYTIDGDQIVLKDTGGKGECAGEGKYRWKFDGKTLTFTRIEDDCAGRTHHLTSRPWPRIKQTK